MNTDVNLELVEIDMSDVKTRNTVVVTHEIANTVKHSANHLSKWLNENLTIDYDCAKNLIKDDMHFSKYQKISYLAAIENLKSNNIYASRNRETDNRLHSNLSNLPKVIRPYLLYDGESLVNYDIKSSQPYFMVALVEFLQKSSKEGFFCDEEGNGRSICRNINFNRIVKKKLEDKSLIWQNLRSALYSSTFQEEYKTIKRWILEGVFYSEMMEILYPFKPYQGKWERKVPKLCGIDGEGKEITTTISKYYTVDNKEEEKAMIKESVFSILYGGSKNPGREFKDFKNHFPAFSNFLLILKENDKKDFPILLQQIESACVLDYVTKEIAKIHPEMPLFTIHDSIATTESYSEKVDIKTLICNLIEKFTGITPIVEEEFFNLNYYEKN